MTSRDCLALLLVLALPQRPAAHGEAIQNSDSVSLVVKNGVAYAPEDLERRAP